MIRSAAQKIWRKLYWHRYDRNVGRRIGENERLLYFGDSLGDNLLCTIVARKLVERDGGSISVLTPFPELFENLPAVLKAHSFGWGDLKSLRRLGREVIHPNYNPGTNDPDRDTAPAKHIIAEMCSSAGLTGSVALKSDISLKPDERGGGGIVDRQVIIMSSSAGARVPMRNKDWLHERYEDVVEQTRHRFNFIQIGTLLDPPIRHAQDLRGTTNLRQSAAILANSVAFVGQVGFLMHLARSVDCRSVIIYGGRERPDESGYTCNENLFSTPPCSPCWQRNHCDFNRTCLDAIRVEDVVRALDRTAARHGEPLRVDTVEI